MDDEAGVIAGAVHEAVQEGGSVTSDQFEAGMAELRTGIAGPGKRLSAQIAGLRTGRPGGRRRLTLSPRLLTGRRYVTVSAVEHPCSEI